MERVIFCGLNIKFVFILIFIEKKKRVSLKVVIVFIIRVFFLGNSFFVICGMCFSIDGFNIILFYILN